MFFIHKNKQQILIKSSSYFLKYYIKRYTFRLTRHHDEFVTSRPNGG